MAAAQRGKAAASRRKAAVEGITTAGGARHRNGRGRDAGQSQSPGEDDGQVQDQAARVIQREIVRATGSG